MRKNFRFIFLMLTLLVLLTGCGADNKVKVYEKTEETIVSHEEKTFTAVVSNIDIENNVIGFVACIDGAEYSLDYHGGVTITDTKGSALVLGDVSLGMVMDVVYYEDTGRLVSMTANPNVNVLKGINKLTIDQEALKAVYKGTSVATSEYLTAYDGDKKLDIREISTEDQVTLYIYGSRLVSVAVELGHGYVRLENQNTYVGGMVEIGYDVIVPVTNDMLLTVREGTYTLRISNSHGYNGTKEVTVLKDKETSVDISTIAVPTGTATINVTPVDAEIFVNGKKISGYAYTDLYGTYSLKITADGYSTFNGSFKIQEPLKVFDVSLKEKTTEAKDDDEDETEEGIASSTSTEDDTTESSGDTGSSNAGNTNGNSNDNANGNSSGNSNNNTSENGTTNNSINGQSGQDTGNKITVKGPSGVGVYVDGEYVGIAPVSFPKREGTHNIILYSSGYLIKNYNITVVNDGTDDEYTFDALTSLSDLVE